MSCGCTKIKLVGKTHHTLCEKEELKLCLPLWKFRVLVSWREVSRQLSLVHLVRSCTSSPREMVRNSAKSAIFSDPATPVRSSSSQKFSIPPLICFGLPPSNNGVKSAWYFLCPPNKIFTNKMNGKVFASKSGWQVAELVRRHMRHAFGYKKNPQPSLLILDAYKAWTNDNFKQWMLKQFNVHVITIPCTRWALHFPFFFFSMSKFG